MADKKFTLVAVLKSDIANFKKGMGDASLSFKDFSKESKKIQSSLKSIAAITGIGLGFAGIGSIAGKAITDIKEFEAALSSLSAITGATGNDLKFYQEAAIKTSEKTRQSANDIVKAYEKVGSASPILLKNKEALAKVAEQAIILSEASGGQLGLDGAIEAVTASMNQFNISGKDASRIINVLAAGSLEGSAGVTSISEAMKNVGTVAATSNMSLEQTVAALEVLGEKQLMGAEAGTKLRGVILKLQDAGLGYATGTFNLKNAIEEANTKLAGMGTELEKDAFKAKIFGTENITAGKIILDNVDKYEKLTKAVTGTNTALTQQAIQNDNWKGDLTELSTTWESFVLGLNSGSGIITKALRSVTQSFTNAIKSIKEANKSQEEIVKEVQNATIASSIEKDKEELTQLTEAYSKTRTSAEAYTKAIDDLKASLQLRLNDWNTSSEETILNARIKALDDLKNSTLVTSNETAILNKEISKTIDRADLLKEYLKNINWEEQQSAIKEQIDLYAKFLKLDLNQKIENPTELTQDLIIRAKMDTASLNASKIEFSKFTDDLNQMIEQFTADFITNVAETLTTALIKDTDEGWANFFNNLIGMFGDFLMKLGGMMIMYGTLMKALQSAEIPAIAKIAIGVAAVALGVAMKEYASSQTQKFALGGIVAGSNYTGDRVPALLNSNEMVLTTGQQSNLFRMLNGGYSTNGMALTGKLSADFGKLTVGIEAHRNKLNAVK